MRRLKLAKYKVVETPTQTVLVKVEWGGLFLEYYKRSRGNPWCCSAGQFEIAMLSRFLSVESPAPI